MTGDETASESMIGERALVVASALFLFFLAAIVALSIRFGTALNYVSGVWLTLAMDAASGTLYRPLISETGIGGTRYFPVNFLTIASLIRGGLPPIIAGHVVTLASGALLVVGVYRLLRELEVPRGLARASAALAMCSYSAVFALATIRGDILPAALNVWGLVFGARLMRGTSRPGTNGLAAGACFCLAFLAKPTTVFGLAAAGTALFLKSKQRGRALKLVVFTVGAAVVLLAAVNLLSDGRMLESFQASGTGGAGLSQFLDGPRRFMYAAVRQDPMSITLLVLAMTGLIAMPYSGWSELPTWAAVYALIAMVIIYGIPGVDFNHLIDFYAIALVFIIVQIARHRLPRQSVGLALALSAALSIVMLAGEFKQIADSGEVAQLPEVARYIRQINRPHQPLFAQHPLIPIMNGQPVFLLDPWMFKMIGPDDPRIRRSLDEKVSRRYFGVVVVGGFIGAGSRAADPRTESGRQYPVRSVRSKFHGSTVGQLRSLRVPCAVLRVPTQALSRVGATPDGPVPRSDARRPGG